MQDANLCDGSGGGEVPLLVLPAPAQEVQEDHRRDRLRSGDQGDQASQDQGTTRALICSYVP